MANLEQVMTEIIARISKLENEMDDLKSSAGETTSLDTVSVLPSSPYDGQIVLLNDGSGVNQNGSFRRYDESVNDWIEI